MKHIYKSNDVVKGIVSGIQPYGAFVNLELGGTGLVHISEISDDYVRNIEDYLQVGEEATFLILEYNPNDNHAKLSFKRIKENVKKRKSPAQRRRKKDLEKNKDLFPSIKEIVLKEESKIREETLIKVDYSYTLCDIDWNKYQESIDNVDKMIRERSGKGGDSLGWLDYSYNLNEKELVRINNIADEIRDMYDVFVVVGIGGSYLGSKAGIEMIKGFYSKLKTEIIFFGNTFSSNYAKEILDYLADKNFAINVISKSGTTLETAIGFRLLKSLMLKKFGAEDTRRRIYVTTDKDEGKLRELTNKEGYTSFIIPTDIVGRCSVITPVGLLPLAVAGVDIMELMQGCRKAALECSSNKLDKNPAYQYALLRRLLGQDKPVELLVTYDPGMIEFAEWWKQLYGESEGKEGKGIFPASVNYSTDLHSLGQFVQDGSKILFETVLLFSESDDLAIPKARDGQASLKAVEGRNLGDVNKIVAQATIEAHNEGDVPNIVIRYPSMDAFGFGYLVYFFIFACVASSYLLDVNPCNQDSVEIYKRRVKELLSK